MPVDLGEGHVGIIDSSKLKVVERNILERVGFGRILAKLFSLFWDIFLRILYIICQEYVIGISSGIILFVNLI